MQVYFLPALARRYKSNMGLRTGNPRGRPKGFDKERARQRLREIVFQQLDGLVEAQVKNGLGIRYLVSRDNKTGKFTKLSEDQAKARLSDEAWAAENEIIEIWDERPNVQAFTDLMNRTIDKPTEQVTADITANVVYRWKDQE